MGSANRFLSDNELISLRSENILVEALQGLVKVDKDVALAKGVKLRIGCIVTGSTVLGPACDIGLAGGAIIENSQLGQDSAVTGGGKIFHSVSGPRLRNYGSQIKHSKIGSNFIIRSMAETKNLIAGNACKMKMFSRCYNSEMGDSNLIGSHSILNYCKIGDRNEVGDYCSLENCRMGDDVNIGSYVHIKGNNEGDETIIEDRVKLGDHVVIHPGTRIYTGTEIPDYALVFTRDGKTVMSLIDMNKTFEG